MDLVDHFRIIRHNWWRVLLAAIVVAGAVFAWATSTDEVFRAETLLLVSPGEPAGVSPTPEDIVFLTQTYAELTTTRPVVDDGVEKSGLDISSEEAENRITAGESSDVGFLQIAATGPSRDDATALAAGMADALVETVQTQQTEALLEELSDVDTEIGEVEEVLSQLAPDAPERAATEARLDALLQSSVERRTQRANSVSVISPAIPDPDPVSPTPRRDAALAFIVTLIVAAEVSVGINYFGDRFRDVDVAEMSDLEGLPVLGRVPRGDDDVVMEAFRILRTNLFVLPEDERPHTLAVVSANASAGKTFTAVHLARTVASTDRRVVLVDADLRRPAVHERVGTQRAPGLSEVLHGSAEDQALRRVPDEPTLMVLTSGAPVDDPAGLLSTSRFDQLLASFTSADLVIVDTPPGTPFADARAVAARCDATILVVDARSSRRRVVSSLIEALQRGGSNVIGVVVNKVAKEREADYYSSD